MISTSVFILGLVSHLTLGLMGWDDALIALAFGAATAGVGAALAPKPPGAPNVGAATVAGVQADLDTLPMRRQIEAAARLGKKVTVKTGESSPIYESQKMVNVGGSIESGPKQNAQWVPYVESEWQPGGKYAYQGSPVIKEMQVEVGRTDGTKDYDFTGKGDIDNQVDLSKKMAASMLDLQRKYGVDFAKVGVEQEELADPESAAARKELIRRIEEQAAKEQARPVANELRNQIASELASRDKLDESQSEAIRRTLLDRAARGDAATADVAGGIAARMAPDLEARRQGKMLGLLTSGATPDDARYRKEQQDLANLGSFLSGTNPVAQFSNLSGAQGGTTPISRAPALPNVSGGAGAAGQAGALSNYNAEMAYAKTQANPWMAGMSLALKGVSAAGNAGWKPVG